MRVLVIGGTELISLHLVRALLSAGHEVAVDFSVEDRILHAAS